MEVNLKAPAKVNLCLLVGKKRSDGYHDIDSIFAAVDIYDYVSIKKSDKGPSVNCPGVSDRNIGWEAIQIFQETYDINPEVEISIKKNIPIGRGLGGGSSDGAAILVGLHKMFGFETKQANNIGIMIGSDVPFFFKGGIARVTGRGETVEPLPFTKLKLAIISPPFPVSTGWAYQALDQSDIPNLLSGENVPPDILDFSSLSNSFEKIIFDRYPELYKIKSWLLESGAEVALLSGSGSAVFGIFKGQIPEEIPFPDHELFVCRTINWGVV